MWSVVYVRMIGRTLPYFATCFKRLTAAEFVPFSPQRKFELCVMYTHKHIEIETRNTLLYNVWLASAPPSVWRSPTRVNVGLTRG